MPRPCTAPRTSLDEKPLTAFRPREIGGHQSRMKSAAHFTSHSKDSAQVPSARRESARITHDIQVMKRPCAGKLVHDPHLHFLRNGAVDALARLGKIVPGAGQN